jgi:hypothetical protein
MVDEAVCCEPLSASNSLIIRENAGNLFVSSPLGWWKSVGLYRLFREIPYSENREFLERVREIRSPIRVMTSDFRN